MSAESSQPQNYDLVLGGENTPPVSGVVLGGIEGIKRLLVNGTVEQRIALLPKLPNYGERGIDLVMRSLRDEAEQVQEVAYELLRDRPEVKVKLALELFLENTKYRRLRNFLAMKKWQEADWETTALMLKICGLETHKRLNPHNLVDFPRDDLFAIDRLWRKHSNGHFGFSVQKRIWENCRQWRSDRGEAWALLGDRIGWRVNNLFVSNHWKRYDEISFSSNSPVGHLPFVFGILTVEAICDRLKAIQVAPTILS